MNHVVKLMIFSFIGVVVFLFGACGSLKKSTDKQKDSCAAIKVLETTFKTDPFSLDSVWIDNENCLNLIIGYDGGCGEVQCELYYTHRVLESFPPKTALWIRFKDDDPCRSEATKHFRFKLTSFESYAQNGGILFTFATTTKQVLYQTVQD